MKRKLEHFLKPVAVLMLTIVIISSSCTASGKLRKPPAPPTPAGMQKPPTP